MITEYAVKIHELNDVINECSKQTNMISETLNATKKERMKPNFKQMLNLLLGQ